MATWNYELIDPPTEPHAQELWLQHAAGFIIMEDVRRYAIDKIDSKLTAESRAAAQKGIDDAVYGLMMIIEGVSGGLANARHTVHIDFIARFAERNSAGMKNVLSEIDLSRGDGMCTGYHGWVDGDFGKHPISRPKPIAETRP